LIQNSTQIIAIWSKSQREEEFNRDIENRSPPFFLDTVWASASGGFRIVSDRLNNNNNKHDNVYGAVIMTEPLREFTWFI